MLSRYTILPSYFNRFHHFLTNGEPVQCGSASASVSFTKAPGHTLFFLSCFSHCSEVPLRPHCMQRAYVCGRPYPHVHLFKNTASGIQSVPVLDVSPAMSDWIILRSVLLQIASASDGFLNLHLHLPLHLFKAHRPASTTILHLCELFGMTYVRSVFCPSYRFPYILCMLFAGPFIRSSVLGFFFSFPFCLCMIYFKIYRPVSAGFCMIFDLRLPQILSPVATIPRTLRPATISFSCRLCHLCLARDADGSCYFLAMRVSASWVSSIVRFSESITGFSQQERSNLRRPCLLTNFIIIGDSNIVDGRNLCARFYGSLLNIRSHGANFRFLYVASVLLWHWPVVVRISSLLLPHHAYLGYCRVMPLFGCSTHHQLTS